MSYYFSTTLDGSVEQVRSRVEEALKAEGFGVLTEIDVQATLKKKLGEDMAPYLILGACNPQFAHKALQAENKIGTMLPCNVILRATDGGRVEVAAVDPIASMQGVDNASLGAIAEQVQQKLRRVIESL